MDLHYHNYHGVHAGRHTYSILAMPRNSLNWGGGAYPQPLLVIQIDTLRAIQVRPHTHTPTHTLTRSLAQDVYIVPCESAASSFATSTTLQSNCTATIHDPCLYHARAGQRPPRNGATRGSTKDDMA